MDADPGIPGTQILRKTDKWINNPNYPDKDMYKSAVVDYAMNNAQIYLLVLCKRN